MMCDTERELIKKDLLCTLRWARSGSNKHICVTKRSMYPSSGYKHSRLLVLDREDRWTSLPISLHEDVDLRHLFADVMLRFSTRDPIRCQVHVEKSEGIEYLDVAENDSVTSLRLDGLNTMALVFY